MNVRKILDVLEMLGSFGFGTKDMKQNESIIATNLYLIFVSDLAFLWLMDFRALVGKKFCLFKFVVIYELLQLQN